MSRSPFHRALTRRSQGGAVPCMKKVPSPVRCMTTTSRAVNRSDSEVSAMGLGRAFRQHARGQLGKRLFDADAELGAGLDDHPPFIAGARRAPGRDRSPTGRRRSALLRHRMNGIAPDLLAHGLLHLQGDVERGAAGAVDDQQVAGRRRAGRTSAASGSRLRRRCPTTSASRRCRRPSRAFLSILTPTVVRYLSENTLLTKRATRLVLPTENEPSMQIFF